MSGILVVAEARRGALREVSLELVSAALELKEAAGGPLRVALIDADPAAHVPALSLAGVDELLLVRSPEPAFEAHVAERALGALLDEAAPVLVLLAHSIDAFALAPAVAIRRGLGFAGDVTAVRWEDGGPLATRGLYGEKVAAELAFPGREAALLTLRPGAWRPAAAGEGSPAVRELDVALDGAARTRHVAWSEPESDGVDITRAPLLVSVGRGIEDESQLEAFEALAERLGGQLSVSRPLVDAGWAPSSRQVGQSGRTVKPRVYLAFGISGAVQHLAGMREAETVVAVNRDPEAPIMGVADYAAVADMFDVADALHDALA